MSKNRNIYILSVCDENFVQHLGVTMASLLENSEKPSEIIYSVIDVGISDSSKDKIISLFKNYNSTVRFITADKSLFDNFPTTESFPVAIYYRLLMPLLLGDSINKVIYLDSDIIVKDDIYNLWEIDIGDYPLAAVSDNLGYQRFSELNIPESSSYFNSGVLLVNLEAWRTQNLSRRVIEYIDSNKSKLLWPDQDALNAILYNEWFKLHPKWNVQRNLFQIHPKDQVFELTDIQYALENPSIIHFTTNSKPWHYSDQHPFKREYYHYLSYTDWRNFKQADKTILNIIKKRLRKFIPGSILKFIKKKIVM